jgi:parallel beta-helix repeat protein
MLLSLNLSVIFVVILVIQSISIQSHQIHNSVIIVDNEGDGDYLTIQDAINHANPGDVIQIYSGIYNETLLIQKERITLEGISHELGSGIDDNHPIINGGKNGNVIEIIKPACQISGCIVQNSGNGFLDAGIVISSNDTIISANGFVGNRYGIVLNNASNNHIYNNYILANSMDGIYLLFTYDNTISQNIIRENGFQGIFLYDSGLNQIMENTISLNGKDGVHLRNYCVNNEISENVIHSNSIDGIKIMESNVYDNILNENEIYSNGWNGVHVIDGSTNIISDNEIYLNLLNGIHVGFADNNKIIRNTVYDNKGEGIVFFFDGAVNNKIYYNNIINDNGFDSGSNTWDDGRKSGGNYWSYYTGQDTDDDGLGETPYLIQGVGNQDCCPFMKPLYPPEIPQKPRGKAVGTPGTAYKYTTVTSDSSYNKVQYGWDWNGDFIVDEWTDFYLPDQSCETVHIYIENGTYTVQVKALDNQGFQSDWSEPLSVTMPKQKQDLRQVLFGFFKSVFILRLIFSLTYFFD